jgi:hypothetical protein
MALKKSDPYSSRLVMCDDLRRGMDASEYKCDMLFIKHISSEYGDSDNFVSSVIIREDASFKYMVALQVKPSGGA